MGWYFWGDASMDSCISHFIWKDEFWCPPYVSQSYLFHRLKFPTQHWSVPSWKNWSRNHLFHRFVFLLAKSMTFLFAVLFVCHDIVVLLCFSVILTDFSYQLLLLLKGTWNFWLGAWMIFHQSRTRYGFNFVRHNLYSWHCNQLVWLESLAMQFQYYYRNLSRQQSQQQAWLQKRRWREMLIPI
jgi:hypothetical protein